MLPNPAIAVNPENLGGNALANPKRLMIVDVLGRGPSTVTEIADWLNLSLPNASQHLRVMRDRGIVRARRDGREVRYALRNPVLSESCQIVRRALLADSRLPPARFDAVKHVVRAPRRRAAPPARRTRAPVAVAE